MSLTRKDFPRATASEIAPGLFHCAGKPIAEIASDTIIAVTYVRDEAWRLPFWLAYHRWLGVERFIMIDNASVDHTYDLLAEQPDVTLVSAPGRFEWYAWTNVIMRLCPPAAWALALDADELLVTAPWRQGGLRQTTSALEAEGAETAFTLMVDCHGETLAATGDYAPAVSWRRAPWFDRGPYAFWIPWKNVPSLFKSGARERLAWPGWKNWRYIPGIMRPSVHNIIRPLGFVGPPLIVKAALHRARSRGPSIHNAGSPHSASSCFSLLHYKLDIDLPQKVQCALAERQHWDDSVEYKAYAALLEKPPGDLRTSESRRFTGLASLIDAKVCRLNTRFLSRIRESGPIDTPIEQAEAELARFGDRHLAPSVPLSLFA